MIEQGAFQGHKAFWLDNGWIRIGVLPEKGADIFELIYKPRQVQFLMNTPWGLKPPGKEPQTDFLENYEGGWNELFPNHSDACEYRGKIIPFHGEVATLPWKIEALEGDEASSAACLSVQCRQTPFRLERWMTLPDGESMFILSGKVTNRSSEPCEFVWGQHVTLGGNFLEQGCVLEAPAGRIITPEQLTEPATARLAPGQDSPWPCAVGRNGERIDLRLIPGPEAHTHDDAFLTGFTEGWLSVTNPRLGLRFRLDWDAQVYPWITLWQPYGGAEDPPLTGIYGVGIEPWVSRFPLAQAIQAGQARSLEPGKSLETEVRVRVELT